MSLRIAFIGASGTGKSTLAVYAAGLTGLTINPVGSRSVAGEMGFASPYEVDRAGRRAEFQRRLLAGKVAWEVEHDDFVTDRTTLDQLAYHALHDVHSVDAATLDLVAQGLKRYTHVFYCPVSAFCDPGDDPARVKELSYHQVYDALLCGLMALHKVYDFGWFIGLDEPDLDRRRGVVRYALESRP